MQHVQTLFNTECSSMTINKLLSHESLKQTEVEIYFITTEKWKWMVNLMNCCVKVARYSFSASTPPKFERKLPHHKQRFGNIATTVVLDKNENLLWSGLQWHRSCHSNKMMPLPILLAAVFLGTRNCSSKIVYRSFFLQ